MSSSNTKKRKDAKGTSIRSNQIENGCEGDDDQKYEALEARLATVEEFLKPSSFRKLTSTPVFPIHHDQMPDEIVVYILACLSHKEYLSCKLVCKTWDGLRHTVAIKRKEIRTPVKHYMIHSKNYPALSWNVINRETVRIGDVPRGDDDFKSLPRSSLFEIVPAIYKPGDEHRANNFNWDRFNAHKDTLVSFKCVSNGQYLRHCSYWIRNHPYNDDAIYRMDATFYMRKNEFFNDEGKDYYSFRSINYDHMHLCHRGYQLRIDHSGDSDLHQNDASFVLDEKN